MKTTYSDPFNIVLRYIENLTDLNKILKINRAITNQLELFLENTESNITGDQQPCKI